MFSLKTYITNKLNSKSKLKQIIYVRMQFQNVKKCNLRIDLESNFYNNERTLNFNLKYNLDIYLTTSVLHNKVIVLQFESLT